MPTFANSRLPKPEGWSEFEKIVCSVAKLRWSSVFTRHGRQGQPQSGVDIFGKDERGALIGIQCKNTLSGVSKSTIHAEVRKAEKFKPRLSKFYIATTAEPDVHVQNFVRSLSEERLSSGQFEVGILFWGDLWDELARDPLSLYQHYPQLEPKPSASSFGLSHDRRLFEKFQSELACDPAISLLREHDFRRPYPGALIQPLIRFADGWTTVEHEFIDDELRRALEEFHSAAWAMSNRVTNQTGPVGSRGRAAVYSDFEREMGPRSEHVLNAERDINQAAAEFVPQYEAFVRLCRTKLAR